MTKIKPVLCAAALAIGVGAASGCVGDGVVHAQYGVSASYSQPEMAYVGNGIWVVEDYDYPVFYDAGMYWAYRDGVWLRSSALGRSWVTVDLGVVPTRFRHIYRPGIYAHYRARPGMRVRTGVHGRVYVRDHRDRVYRQNARRDRYDYRRDRYYRDRSRRWRD